MSFLLSWTTVVQQPLPLAGSAVRPLQSALLGQIAAVNIMSHTVLHHNITSTARAMNKPRATVQSTSSKATINSPIRTQRSQATGLRDPVKPSKQASSRSHAIVPNSSALSEIMWEAIRHGVKNGPRSTILSMVERWKSNRLILYPKSIDCDNLVQISLQQRCTWAQVHTHSHPFLQRFIPISCPSRGSSLSPPVPEKIPPITPGNYFNPHLPSLYHW